MTKTITTIALAFAMVGCAGTSQNTQVKQTLQAAKGYQVGQVNVTLAKQGFYDFSEEEKQYPNEEKLATFFKEDIEKYLKKEGRSCQGTEACLTLDVDFNYLRNFNLGSVSVSAPTTDRTIVIHKGDTIVYNNTQKGLKPFKDGVFGKALNELAVFSKAGEDKANLEDERNDIDLISQITVKDIVQLGK